MSISKDSFQQTVKNICDRWYFEYDRQGALCLKEKPFVRLGPREPDPVVDWFEKDHIFTSEDVKRLKWMHMIRQKGLQREVVESITKRNNLRKAAESRQFHRTNREIFKQAKSVFKKERSEAGITSHSVRDKLVRTGVKWDDTTKVINKMKGYAEKHAAGEAVAQHPHVILEKERQFQTGEQVRLVAP